MKIRMLVAAFGAAAAAASFAVPASAQGANLGITATSVAYGSLDLATLGGDCTYARTAVGLGGSGITYSIAGVGTAGGTYRGIPVVATGIRCRLLLPSATVTSGPEYLPGAVGETDTSYTTNDASGGLICTTVYGVLRQTPPGETDNLISTREFCH